MTITNDVKISIIIPNFNHSSYIEGSINSAINQTYHPDEILIIDDASTDNSPAIIKKYEILKNVRVIYRKENKGIIYNINDALNIAKGDFILFLAADDFLEPNILKLYHSFLEKHPDVGFFCSLSNIMLDDGVSYQNRVSSKIPSGYISPSEAKKLIYKYDIWPWFSGNTMLVNRLKIIENGGQDPSLGRYADGWLYINLAIKYGLVFIPESLSTLRKLSDSFSSSTIKDIEKLSFIENKVISHMRLTPEYFDSAFIKRWKSRWRHLRLTSQSLYGNKPILIKFIVSSFLFLRYRWFDIFNLRLASVLSFFREGKKRKV